MKIKLKLLSIIFFVITVLIAFPCISNAYENEEEVPINYTIKINKIDTADNKNLKGAKFQLKDINGQVISTQTTDETGVLSFGNLKTFGAGTDTYFIDEIRTPKGYILDEKETIEVDVEKTITNVETGAYKLKITCQTLNYLTDITRYDFVPVSTIEQLSKIGSNEEFTYEGKIYKYTPTTNYKLMNDIDLNGIDWEPIETPINGIFDGNGHTIKNLKLVYNSESNDAEVGLFKSFTGIVEGLNLENVTIVVPAYSLNPESISGKSGVGAFTGYMGGGTFKDCTVSGNITSGVSNVGGLVGHSAENVIIKFQNCTNNANITVYDNAGYNLQDKTYNAGGLIGCAVCSLSLTDCINNGIINGNAGNIGGLVGYVKSEGYEEKTIKAGYAEDGNTITLVVGNSRTAGEYDLYLEDYDLRTLNILPGGIFTVYDAALEPIEGFENVKLEDGKLKIGSVNIKYEGKDTYFVKDVTPVEGYRRIAGYIKVVVTRYWDFEADKFRVTVDEKVIAEDKIWDEIGSNTNELDSITDSFAPDITFENVGWNNAKASFVRCKNNAEVKGYVNIGGIIGRSNVKVTMDTCQNNALVGAYSYGKAGGMIGEITYWNKGALSELNNCTNTGAVESMGNYSTGSAGGMVAQSITDIKLTNCKNTGEIRSSGASAASGLLCDATGYIYIDECSNEGKISALTTNNCDVHAGGIIGKNISKTYLYDNSGNSTEIYGKEKTNVTIKNTSNTGDISSGCHLGGIIGYSEANSLTIDNCNVLGKNDTEKLNIDDTYASDKGAIGGYISVPNVSITNCTIDNVNLHRSCGVTNNTYGSTGGIIGNWCGEGNVYTELLSLNIEKCNVSNSIIQTRGQSIAGILGAAKHGNNSVGTINIKNCNIDKCSILNDDIVSTYASTAGIIAMSQSINNITIDNCIVNETTVKGEVVNSSSGGDQDTAGIAAMLQWGDNFVIKNSKVTKSHIINNAGLTDGCANCCGIAGYVAAKGYDSKLKISDCTVENTDVTTTTSCCAGVLACTGSYGRYYGTNVIPVEVTGCTLKNSNVTSTTTVSTSSIVSGIGGYMNSPSKYENNNVENSKIKLNTYNYQAGTNIVGIIGMSSEETIINNCHIKDSELYSNGAYCSYMPGGLGNVAGIAGYVGDNSKITKCSAINTSFTGDNLGQYAPSSANVAGIIGCFSSKGTLEECDVKDCVLTGKATAISNDNDATVAGIVGVGGDLNIKDSNVQDCIINGAGMEIAGVVGCATNSANIQNVTAKNITITDSGMNVPYDSYHSYPLRNIGGIIGYALNFKGNNLTVDNINVDSHAVTIGGIAGALTSVSKLENANVNKFTVTNDPITNGENGSVAGFVGDIYEITANSIKNCSVTNSGLSTKCHNASGFIGTINSNAKLENITVNNINATNLNQTATGLIGDVAGLVSYTGGKLNLDNVKVNNSIITQSAYAEGINGPQRHAGGYVAYASGDVTITNSELKSNTISNPNGGLVGGMIGIIVQNSIDSSTGNTIERNIIVSNSVLDNNTITGAQNAGGIVAISNKATITNTDVTNSTITAHYGVGGMIGLAYNRAENNVTVNDSDIINTNVTSNSGTAGGVIGYIMANLTAQNVNLNNIKVTNNNVSAGGLCGVDNGKLTATDVNVINNTQITGSSHAGGLAGTVGEAECTRVEVDNSKITSNGGSAGGLVGIANLTVNSTNSTIKNNTQITGSEHVGGVAGKAKILANTTTLNNIKLNQTGESVYSSAGGLVGITDATSNINGVTANGITITPKGGLLGGIVGIMKGSISNVNISNVTINAKTNPAEVGGIAGIMQGELSNSIVDNAILYGIPSSGSYGDVGGAVGCALMDSNINKVDVTNSTIKSEKEAGGIVGVTMSNVTNSSVKGSSVEVIGTYTLDVGGGDAGGAVAASNATVSNVTVRNTTVKSSKLAGGVVGAGIQTNTLQTILENLTVEGNTLTSPKIGQYIAVPNLYAEAPDSAESDSNSDPDPDPNSDANSSTTGSETQNSGNLNKPNNVSLSTTNASTNSVNGKLNNLNKNSVITNAEEKIQSTSNENKETVDTEIAEATRNSKEEVPSTENETIEKVEKNKVESEKVDDLQNSIKEDEVISNTQVDNVQNNNTSDKNNKVETATNTQKESANAETKENLNEDESVKE